MNPLASPNSHGREQTLSHLQGVCEKFSTNLMRFEATEAMFDIASILQSVNASDEMIIVSVLRNLRSQAEFSTERVSNVFDYSVLKLYEGCLPLDRIQEYTPTSGKKRAGQGVQQLGKMIVAMVDDSRVVVVHLAEQLARLQSVESVTEDQRESTAEQSLTIFAPLANQLGIWSLKWQLEDAAFKLLNREAFNQIAALLDERRLEREQFIGRFTARLQNLMDQQHISARVNGRAKHIYGIWRKSKAKGVGFEQIFDLRAVRIIVDDISACYSALSSVHAQWDHVTEEFDDYIAAPKENGYQSIHTAIITEDSKTVEVQIRTQEMHDECEFGKQAHWIYKVGDLTQSNYQEDKVRWLRLLLEWRDEISERFGVKEAATSSEHAIYVFTPAGNVIELPTGSTPVDFAYAVHTQVGHNCRGAKVNGKIVPLTHTLNLGDWVEIKTVKNGAPSRDWLNPNQKFVHSARARHAISRWFRLEEYGRYASQGRALLEKELNRLKLQNVNLDKLATENNYKSANELFTAVGMKELKVAHALARFREKEFELPTELPESHVSKREDGHEPISISVLGVGNLLTSHASCCGPLPGDDVVGYVTLTRGITVHKRNCGNIKRMRDNHPERFIEVNWETAESTTYSVRIEIMAEGSSTLLQEITSVIGTMGLHLTSVNTTLLRRGSVGRAFLTVDVKSSQQCTAALNALRGISGVVKARRIAN